MPMGQNYILSFFRRTELPRRAPKQDIKPIIATRFGFDRAMKLRKFIFYIGRKAC